MLYEMRVPRCYWIVLFMCSIYYTCRVKYATNEEEELNLLEVIEDNQMSLLG